MKVGYPCINWSIGCKADRTFRLRSYSEHRLIETVVNNLTCLAAILRFNVAHRILFFRITSSLVPFASHPICRLDWVTHFKHQLTTIGNYIQCCNIRISMHPGQYVVLNSPDSEVLARSIKELQYHVDVLDVMGLPQSAKIQIHVGGTYGQKEQSLARFVERYRDLDITMRRRLVIENDDRNFTADDCLAIHRETGIPVLFDVYHHALHQTGRAFSDTLCDVSMTWQAGDGLPMVDYSSYSGDKRTIRHMESLDRSDFRSFLVMTQPYDFDVMLEIKDKEASALQAVEIAEQDSRFSQGTIQLR